jgi:hypothetical protein
MNGGGPGRGGGGTNTAGLRIEVGGNDPVSGEPFGAIAGRSRAMHKTQGFGNFGGGGGGPRSESFQLLDGEPAVTDIFDGVDTTWGRVPGGAEIGKLADEAIAQFSPRIPRHCPALLAIRSRLGSLAREPLVDDKRRQLDRVLAACLASSETTVAQVEAVPGEKLSLRHTQRCGRIPVRWMESGIRETGAK